MRAAFFGSIAIWIFAMWALGVFDWAADEIKALRQGQAIEVLSEQP